MEIESASLFRVCRDAEVELDDDDGAEQARARRARSCASAASSPSSGSRSQPDADPAMVAELTRAVRARRPRTSTRCAALLDYTTLFEIAGLDDRGAARPAVDAAAADRARAADGDIFAAIRAGDILLHHPYDSFDASVERFIREAADDPLTVVDQDDRLPGRRRHAVRAVADPRRRGRASRSPA